MQTGRVDVSIETFEVGSLQYERALRIATDNYYWKPMAAFFRWLELRIYLDSNVALAGPILDIGCGDAGVAAMLREGGVLKDHAIGLDVSHRELQKARRRGEHYALVEGDGNRLPFGDGAFGSVVCNGVLHTIPGGVDQAVREIARVLRPGGVFVASEPTDRFLEVLNIPKILARVSDRLAAWYIKRLSERIPLHTMYAADEWIHRFEANDLEIVKSEHFFTPQSGALWNVMTLSVFRSFALLKLGHVRSAAVPLRLFFRAVYRERVVDPPGGGYIFLVARKA
jgi:SAM-dependent methyltransferase